MATAAEILSAIDTALLDVLQNGQEIWFNGRRYTKANITDLQKLRAEYAAIVATESAGGTFDRMKTGAPYRV